MGREEMGRGGACLGAQWGKIAWGFLSSLGLKAPDSCSCCTFRKGDMAMPACPLNPPNSHFGSHSKASFSGTEERIILLIKVIWIPLYAPGT